MSPPSLPSRPPPLMRADAMRVLVWLRPTMARFAPSAAIASAADRPMPVPRSRALTIVISRASRREKLTVRQLAQRLGGHSGLAMVGTPATIAEEMEEWLMTEGSDGFTIQFPYLPGGLDDFVDRVVPELQRRGIFRREYEGKTLRDNLELPRPKNRFF
jgi:alkanesulfonate monooxygenase SsuD/methylene tetrahydromethanopterin reductase-like flavin-dependent oxidoreductase (luciferase family)